MFWKAKQTHNTRMIKLNSVNNHELIRVRVSSIESYRRNENGGTIINLVSGNWFRVEEEPEHIDELIG